MPTASLDLRRELGGLYRPGRSPAVVQVPELGFLMIDGHGDPNTSEDYRDAVSALYSIAYVASFALKRSGVLDYKMMPLEGLWWADDMSSFSVQRKSDWSWTMMIMQPDALTPAVVAQARDKAAGKASEAAVKRVRLERFAEGPVAQVLHVGPYSAEGPTVAALHAFILEQGRELAGRHHEIYLGDPTRSAPEKLRTIIRQPMR